MRRLKVFGVVLMAVFALGALLSSSASALPKALPEASAMTGSGATATLSTLKGEEVVCKKHKDEGEFTKEGSLGTFHIHFEECLIKILGVLALCKSLGHTGESEILALGELHLVFDSLTTLGLGFLFLIPKAEPIHFECVAGVVKVLIKVWGHVLCLITPVETASKEFKVKCEASSVGDPKEKIYWNDEGKEVTAELLTEVNDNGKPEGSAESAPESTETVSGGGTATLMG